MRKRMKCWLIALVMLALCVGTISPTKVLATENTYRLEDLELEITIPDGYTAITKDTPDNDPIFSEIGMIKSDFVSLMESGSIYMEIFPADYTEEIIVTMQPNDFSDFNSLSDDDLRYFADMVMDMDLGSEYGYDMKYFDYKLYEHSQTKFIIEYFTDSTNSTYGLQYYTILDGKAMNFTLRSYTGPISTAQEDWMKGLVDSVKFDSEYVNFGHTQEIGETVYINEESGLKFTMPENWVQNELSQEREFVDVKFGYTLDVGVFVFGATDAWGNMSAVDRIGYERSDLNNSLFSMDDMKEMFGAFTEAYGVAPDEIEIVTYNGVEYYKGDVAMTVEEAGVTADVEFTILYRMDNGWMYYFNFGERKGADLHNDFEQIMNSVQYPENAGAISSGSPKGNAILMVTFIALLILAMVVIVLKVNRKKKSNNTTIEYNPLFAGNNLESPNKGQEAVFCRNCGKELPKDSAFCHHCGTKLDI